MVMSCQNCRSEIGKPGAFPSFIYFWGGAVITGMVLAAWKPDLYSGAVLFPFLWFVASLLLSQVPLVVFFLIHFSDRCPECGHRGWNYPHHGGHGL